MNISFGHKRYSGVCLTLCGLLVVTASIMCGDDPKPLQFKETQFDFGKIKQGTQCEHIFEYTNVSRDTLFLDHPRASCGCTAALLTDDILAPGKSGKITVRFSPPAGSSGLLRKTVTVSSKNDGVTYETLTIIATVSGDIEATPSVIRFEAVPGEKRILSVKLKSLSDHPLSLDNISASLMDYHDTTSGAAYHADKVVGKPFTNFALSASKLSLQPKDSCDLKFVVNTEHKGQINGSIRIATGKMETSIHVVGVVIPKAPASISK